MKIQEYNSYIMGRYLNELMKDNRVILHLIFSVDTHFNDIEI